MILTEHYAQQTGDYPYRAMVVYTKRPPAPYPDSNIHKVNDVYTTHRCFPTLKGAKGWLQRQSKRKGVVGLEIEKITESWYFELDKG